MVADATKNQKLMYPIFSKLFDAIDLCKSLHFWDFWFHTKKYYRAHKEINDAMTEADLLISLTPVQIPLLKEVSYLAHYISYEVFET